MAKTINIAELNARLAGLSAAVQGRLHAAAKHLRTTEPPDVRLAAGELARVVGQVASDIEAVRVELSRGRSVVRAGE